MICQLFRWSCVLLLLCIHIRGSGQSYNFINYNITDGLAHERVVSICQDQYGTLWMATLGGGLSSYNGKSFRNYTEKDGLGSNIVRDVLADKNGHIWAATAAGISRFDGDRIKNYLVGAENDDSAVGVIFEDHQGDIWFSGPQGGVGKIDTRRDTIIICDIPNIAPNDKVVAIAEDRERQLWFITAIKGLFKKSGDQFVHVIKNSDFKGYLLSIFVDDNNILWLGSNKGLLRFDPHKPEKIDDFFSPMQGTFIKSSEVRDSANFWAVSGFGLLQYSRGVLKSFTEKQGLTNTAVNVLFSDREGNIWIGSDGDGIFKLTSEIFIHYGEEHGLPNYPVTCIVKDLEGKVWFGTYGGGMNVLDEEQFVNYSTAHGINNTYIWSSTLDKQGNVWLGTKGTGLIKYNGDHFTYFDTNDGLVYNTVRCLFNDSQNNVWIGTVNGLSRYDGKEFHNYTTEDGLYDNTIWCVSEPVEGRVLIVTRRGLSFFENGVLKKGLADDELIGKRINMALQDPAGNFWIGYSGHGIVRVDGETGELHELTTDHGLTSNLIYNMIFDNEGNLIVSSERGVDKLFLSNDYQIQGIKNYGKTEGFENIQTTHNAAYKDEEGNIWFGAPRGVFKYQPTLEKHNSVRPITYISGVKLFYQEVDWSRFVDSTTTWFNVPRHLQLPYKENNIVIEYFGSSLYNPENVAYKFRLIGLEDQWSPVTNKSEAVYTNLSPGKYTFEVVAANSDNIWNLNPARFTFEIVPPFWQRPWFFVILILLVLLSIRLFNDYRIRANLKRVMTIERIRAEELVKVRKRMARDFHDNMGNQLASITVFANLISLKLKDKSAEVDELLQNIEKHTKSLFNGTKDFIWSIDPESDNLSEVFTYIKDFGEELFENTDISFFSRADDLVGKNLSLPSGWSRQIVLIFKEAMTNALKHSGADEVHLELNLNKNEFVIKLMDNGVGLDRDRLTKGNGFRNMRSRASQIRCTLEVQSNRNRSTSILFKGSIQSELKTKEVKIY